jgi:hypothetical protein
MVQKFLFPQKEMLNGTFLYHAKSGNQLRINKFSSVPKVSNWHFEMAL